jgi:hypothetical protein
MIAFNAYAQHFEQQLKQCVITWTLDSELAQLTDD